MFIIFLFFCEILCADVKRSCINNCSGHGRCNADGVCECFKSSLVESTAGTADQIYPLYGGADCSISINIFK